MTTAVLLLTVLLLLLSGSDKTATRPWYDIRYQDMIELDLFGDDD